MRALKIGGGYRSRTGDLPECFRDAYPCCAISHLIYFLLFFFLISNSLLIAWPFELNDSVYTNFQSLVFLVALLPELL